MKLFEKFINREIAENSALQMGWLDELNELDELVALETTAKYLSAYLANEELSAPERLNALSSIDKQNRQRIAKITAQYTQCDNLKPELETKVSEATYNYYRQIYLNYFNLIEKFIATPDKHVFDYEWLQVLLARALDAATCMIKWRCFKQMPAPANVWLQLFSMYKIAANENLLGVPIQLFEDEVGVALNARLAQVLMLGSLAQANMNRQHVENTSQLLKLWMPTAHIYKNFDAEKFLFYIDTEKDAGAKRIRNFEPGNSSRFLDIEPFNIRLAEAVTALEAKQLPENLSFSEFANHKALLDTLHILRTEWSRTEYKRQRRRESRTKTAKSASICYGIDEVCNQVRHLANGNLSRGAAISAEGKSLDERLSSHSLAKGVTNTYYMSSDGGRWLITDESPQGLGVLVDKEFTTHVAQGKLVSVVLKDQKHQVIVGIIRAIKPLANEQFHVGIEIIANNALWIRVAQAEKSNLSLNTDSHKLPAFMPDSLLAFSGLYLPAQSGLSESSSLLLPRIEFTPNANYQVNIMGMKRLVKLTKIIDGQSDWVRVI